MIVTCPPPETLRRYLLGDFSDGEGAELESHLSECAACEETLSHFDDTHDSLLRHLPLAAGTTEDKNSPWLERLMQGPPPPRDDDPPAEEPAAGLVIEGLENYELTGVLGKGGMGVVYRARHRQLNRPVAIKVIRPKLFSAAEARQRFAREIQILGGLNHPGIVAATDAGKIGPAAYLVMELIDGVDFSRLVRRGGPLAIGEACEVARQIAAALSAVHEAGAIHRDVKPSNVMLDRAGRVKLLDFGLAHLAQPEREHPETSMGRLLGTLDYMAPEQADGEAVGASADLYAIGATLYFLLTGRPPRSGEGEQTLLQQLKSLVQNEIPPLTELRADVPQQLSDLVAQLLAKDPADRPATAPEVAQRLAAWSDREAVERLCEALPPTTGPEGQESISQSISQSLTELLGSQLASKVEPHIAPELAQPAPQPATQSKFRRVGGTLLALAMLGAALWAGITLLIETPSGTIRIESDVAGIQVELLDEQEQTKTLEIKQGENRSELKAGRYRILIAGGHDHLAVTPQEITLQRGEEKIAKITQVAAEGEVVQADSKGQPLYQGEPLSVWEQRFRDEADPLAKIEAGKALVLLARPLPPEERFARIMGIGGQLIGDGWNTPALKLAAVWDTSLSPNVYRPPTSWPTDDRETVIDAYGVLRSLAGSQLAAEEPVALAARLRDHFAQADLNEAWFVVQLIGHGTLENHLRRSQPAVDTILGKLLRREDKDLNRVVLLRSARYFPYGSESSQAEYARLLSVMGKKLAEGGLPAEEAWLGQSWSNAAQVAGVEPKIRAEVAFRQLIDHGTAPTTFDISPDHNRLDLPATIEMAEHWIYMTNRWLENNQVQSEAERLASVIHALDSPLRIRPIESTWKIARTQELVTVLLKQQYEEQSNRRNPDLEPHQLLTQIILCGGEIPEFAKQPPSGDDMQKRLAAFREVVGRTAVDRETRATASGVMFDAPFTTMEIFLTNLGPSSQNRRSNREITPKLQTAIEERTRAPQPGAERWKSADSVLILAILAELSGESPDRDAEIAGLLWTGFAGTRIFPRIQDLLQSEFATRQITEHHLRKIKQRIENEDIWEGMKRLAPYLVEALEKEEAPPAEPAMPAEDPPATQPAEVDHSGPEPLYQGEPVSVWQRRFRAETDPLAKINVGQALITLARPMPEEERFDTVMKIGSELLESGWGASGAIQAIVRHQNAMGYEFHAPRWPASSAEAIEKSWTGLRESIDIQLESIPPGKLAELLTGRVAEGQGLEPHFVLFLLQNTRVGHLTEGIRIVRDNRAASEQIVRKLRPGDGQSAEARHLREAALLVRTLYDASVSEEAQQQLREEMVAQGKQMLEPDFVPVSGDFVRAWRWQAKQLKLDPRLSAEVALAGLVGKWNVVPVEIGLANSPGGGAPWPKNRYGQPWTSGQELFLHWGPVAMDWLRKQSPLEEASAEEREILARVLTSLDTTLRFRRVTDDWDPEDLAQLLVERFPRSVLRDTVVLLCDADLPESSRQPPESEEVQRRLETLRQLLGAGATQYQNGRAQLEGLFDQAPYATLQMIIEAEQLPDEIPPPRVVWDTLQVDAARNPFGHGYQDRDVEPLLLLAITAELAGKSPAHDERILQFFNPGGQLSFSAPLQTGLQIGLKSDGVISQIITRHLRKMKQRAKSEKLREAIDKLVPGLEDTPDVEPDPAMPADAPPATQPAKVDDSGPEALYQGEPVSVWQRRFEVEVNPVSKIEAAEAMITLASRLPPEEQLDRIVKISGELLREGWGDGATSYPLNQYLGIMHTPNRWSMNTYPTIWDDFRLLLSMIDGQIHQISPEILARHLTDQVVGAEPHEAAFAMLPLVGHVRNRKQLNQEAAEILTVELRREDLPQLHRAAFLIRLAGYEAASDEARQKVVDDMQSVGQKLNEKGWEDSKRVQSAFCA